jgi:hypothetical protein
MIPPRHDAGNIKGNALTLYLRIRSLFSMPNIDEVERCFSLREAKGKVSQLGGVLERAILLHCLRKPSNIGTDFCHDFHFASKFIAIVQNNISDDVRSLLSSFDAIADEVFVKLSRSG